MDFEKLAKEGKDFVDEHGGTKALTDEAKELEGIAKGDGSAAEKAKAAAESAKNYAHQEPGGQQ
ncbi:MAG: hypothetical protein KGL15_09560 [Acidobacteriota bacterium]|nr:hypothetical protein [Acidobacteriota bacterium]